MMPCITYSQDELSEIHSFEMQRTSALLCLALRTFDIDKVHSMYTADELLKNENECGITYSSLTEWWRAHQLKDQARQEQERETARMRKVKEQALSKLTPEERRALKT